jgi:polyhydroxyalkanoate synthase
LDIPFLDQSHKYKDVEVGITEKILLLSDNKMNLYRYTPVKKNLNKTPILLVYALINRNYILDLIPGYSFAEFLINKGFDTYIIDWGIPSDEDRFLTLDYFIDRYIQRSVKKTLEHSGAKSLSMFGYCMGGHLATIYAALHNEYIKNLILLATPIDSRESKFVDMWADKEKLDIDKLVDAFGNVPARAMQQVFSLVRDKMEAQYYGDIDAQDAVAKWAYDNIDIAGECFKKYVKDIFQENRLLKGTMEINNRKVNLKKIKSDLMIISGEGDWVAPLKSTLILKELVSSKVKNSIRMDGGHLGFVVKKDAKKIWEELSSWLLKSEPEQKNLTTSENKPEKRPAAYSK